MTRGFPAKIGDEPWNEVALAHHTLQCTEMLARYGFTEPIIQFGNEPDLAHEYWRSRPRALGEMFATAAFTIRTALPRATVLCPPISNLDKDSLVYLSQAFPNGLPDDTACAFHRYPFATNATDAHPGFVGRHQEVQTLRAIVGNETPLYVTEFGMREGPHIKKTLFGLCKTKFWISEADVAQVVTDDLRFWRRHGVNGAAVYQLNSGPDRNDREHTFGIRHFEEPWDGDWKQVAQTLPAIIQEVA